MSGAPAEICTFSPQTGMQMSQSVSLSAGMRCVCTASAEEEAPLIHLLAALPLDTEEFSPLVLCLVFQACRGAHTGTAASLSQPHTHAKKEKVCVCV